MASAPPSQASDLALLFPGQGSQTNDMREMVEAHRPELLELAETEVGSDPFDRLDEGTAYVQPALYCASIALWAGADSPQPGAFAGHSLGELAALAAGGAISVDDGLRLAALRGRLMQGAAEAGPKGGMMAVLGGDELAREIAAKHGVTVANDNAPGQLVLSGPMDAIDGVAAEAKEQGLRAIKLAVAGAFHSEAMTPVLGEFRGALDEMDVHEPATEVWCGTTAQPFADIRDALAQALVSPVRWRETLIELHKAGYQRFVEVGPGKVLKGLVSRTLPDAEASTIASGGLASA